MSQAFFIPDFKIMGIGYNALNKSRDDLHKIYTSLGFLPLTTRKITLNDEKVKYFASNKDVLGDYVSEIINLIDEKCHSGDYLFMDFPFSIKFAGYSKIVSYARTLGVKVIFFIHDLDGVRFQNPILNMTDSTCLDMGYCLISASLAMDKVLENGLLVSKNVRKVDYCYWDYLCPDYDNQHLNALVCFAGNLWKSSFISEIPNDLVNAGFNLYGKGMSETYRGNFSGQYPPEKLVSILDGKFGLVWDGKSAKTCSGNFGKYLKINTSHKFGLYMASGKPVIVWKDSSIAKFVEDNKIGIAVNSLFDVAPALSKVDLYEYSKMRENVSRIKKEVITGKHLSKVILESMK